jgi:hypothetical protein
MQRLAEGPIHLVSLFSGQGKQENLSVLNVLCGKIRSPEENRVTPA